MAVPGYFPVIGFPSRFQAAEFPGFGVARGAISD
jgi:hypothetical protein